MAVCRTPPASRLPAVPGVRMATGRAGLRYRGRDDLVLFALEEGAKIAGVFTRSALPGEPVLWNRRLQGPPAPAGGRARAILATAGNANVHCGPAGAKACRSWAGATARALGCRPEEVWLAATGVIGEPPPSGKVERRLPALAGSLRPRGWSDAARAIQTTDTVEKALGARVRIGGGEVRLAAIAKGSGMIAPDMATTLCFAFTDAKLSPALLRRLLREASAPFNRITVDGHPSTSDMALLAATGKASHPAVSSLRDPALAAFRKALGGVFRELALAVVGDGEGARRVVELRAEGAASDALAEKVVRALAASPLVRTAFAGADPNWGRVIAVLGAVLPPPGKPGAVRAQEVTILLDGVPVCRGGGPVGGDWERRARSIMRRDRYALTVRLGKGAGRAALFTCDLTEGYVAINGSYRN